MTPFEYFMMFYILLLGLAVAEIFGGLANLLRERRAPPFGFLTLALGFLVLLETLTNFIDAWDRLHDMRVSLEDMAQPTAVAGIFFLLAALALPRNLEDGESLDDYFQKHRRVFGVLLLLGSILITIPETRFVEAGIFRHQYAGVIIYIAGNLALFSAYAVLAFCKSRISAGAAIVVAILFDLIFYTGDITGLFAYPSG